ncbi:hypothetical protein HYE15_00870 [Mycoplasmopsis bovis]|nr:hypothetical protein [Mycoplasmopsis bovis]QQH25501.1 hypothetical protein HYE15_00870 [Mycoplasmopsis bovis]
MLDKKVMLLLDVNKKEITNWIMILFIDLATGTKIEILWISNVNLKKHGLDD